MPMLLGWVRVLWPLPSAAVLALLILPVQAAGAPKPDLVPTSLTLGSATLSSNNTTLLQLTVTNRGRGKASSVTAAISIAAAGVSSRIGFFNLGTLGAGASSKIATTLSAPTLPGTYTVIGAVATPDREVSTSNDTITTTLQVTSSSPSTSTTSTGTTSTTPTTSTTTTSSPSSTVSCTKYQPFFDSVFTANKSWMGNQIISGDGQTYYYFSYILGGTLAMFEGTDDPKYLEQMLSWAETMAASAKIIDYQGKKNWSGPWSSPWASAPIAYMLHDLQGSVELARLARIVLTDPSLKAAYGSRAQTTYRFVKDHIVDKWLYTRKAQSWFHNVAYDSSKFYSDKASILVRLLLDLYLIDGNPAYASLASDLLEAFTQRLTAFTGSSLIWDLNVSTAAYDTSHANRMPYTAIDAHAAGIKINSTHLTGLSNLLTRVIWDQSLTSPRFTNYIDGGNSDYGGRSAWGNGQIYTGWVTLGSHDARVQQAAEAVLAAIIAGIRNPSLDYMSTVYGKIALAGYITRNMTTTTGCS